MKAFTTLVVIAAISAAANAADPARTADYDYEAPVPGSYTLPVIKPAADGSLLDSAGKAVRLAELTRGRITVMSFIYTRCAAAKACPTATGVLMQLRRESSEDAAFAKNLRLVSMSFDPVNDTPERMAAYSGLAAARLNAAPWHFVTTRSQAELQPILDAYGQAVDKKQNPKDPTGPLNHTLRVFLVDADGNIRNIYSSGTLDPRLVLADVKTLLKESAKAGSSPPTLSQDRSEADPAKDTGATAIYTLVSVNGNKVPASVSHDGTALEVRSGSFTLKADGSCSAKTVFVPSSEREVTREASAAYTKEGSKLTMRWKGAGRTTGTIEDNTFTMDNEGMVFVYRK